MYNMFYFVYIFKYDDLILPSKKKNWGGKYVIGFYRYHNHR